MKAGLWTTWTPDPLTLVALAAAGFAYARGVRRLWAQGRGRGVGRWRVTAFAGGLAAVAAALVSPLDHAGAILLSAHMGQHLVLILVAAPLLVLGRPWLVITSSLGPGSRRFVHRVGRRPWIRRTAWVLTAPVLVWFLHVVVLWGWHVPGAYQAALGNPSIHALEHASFLGTGMLFWWVALQPGRARRLARGGDVLFLLTAWLQSGALGALFTFASTPVYPQYVLTAARAGVDPLRDQQVAGLIMWVPAGLVYLVGACVLFVAWLRSIEMDTRRAEALAPASPDGAGRIGVRA